MAAATFAFLSTTVGAQASAQAVVDQRIAASESVGIQVSDQEIENIRATTTSAPYIGAISQVIVVPILTALVAAVFMGIFTMVLGGVATFSQVFGVVAHAGLIFVLGALFSLPLKYMNQSLATPTSLGVLLPMVSETTFLGRVLGGIDLFWIWWIINLAIGLGVLYKRPTAPIVWSLLVVVAIFVVASAAVMTMFAGG
jgi:hypothetical protein